MKHALRLLAALLLMAFVNTTASADAYVVQGMYDYQRAYGFQTTQRQAEYTPFQSYSQQHSMTRSAQTRSTNGLVTPFSGAASPYSGAAYSPSLASSDDDDDDWGTGGSSGFDGAGEPGDNFKQPLGAPLVLLLFAALYGVAKLFSMHKTKIKTKTKTQ